MATEFNGDAVTETTATHNEQQTAGNTLEVTSTAGDFNAPQATTVIQTVVNFHSLFDHLKI